ncbi:hypothetical protein G7Z17_g10722 [Cylindrodendrum hubeiense]|uniref:Protein kinase domain-containing protein n=1 Tax=Cylindrodendrum hubeiense TaxID=595255 RepID=A0A9P5LC19_9HYPO|nr:hypothetical protein G7Z17_g10722 [Cylindrodendrum hubeiense]
MINLTVYQRNTPKNPLDGLRNLNAVQGALLRGDREVTLNGTATISNDIRKELRQTHQPYTHQSDPTDLKFRDMRSLPDDKRVSDDLLRNIFGDCKWQGFRFEFVRILGTGGFGAGTLWKIHLEGGVTKLVVIKVPLGKDSYSREEKDWHLRYDGSRHTVQLVDLPKMAKAVQDEYKLKNSDKPLQYDQGKIFNSDLLTGTILEYMSHGDLLQILHKASRQIDCFPDRVLWGIWECLVKGAAAVAYQPIFNKHNRGFEQEMEQAKAENRLDAFLKALQKEDIAHDVHFDLEESNRFSHVMDKAWKIADQEYYWRIRMPIKMTRFTPEQVHQDWDKLSVNIPGQAAVNRFRGDNLTQGNPIAGRYGAWTNIFILAKTMEAAVTFLYRAHPFSAKYYTTIDGRTEGNTYGWRLNNGKYDHVDQGLRDILCQCLFERPLDRPSIVGLLRNIENRKGKGFDETGGDVKTFWDDMFAPQPTMPIPESVHSDIQQEISQALRDQSVAAQQQPSVGQDNVEEDRHNRPQAQGAASRNPYPPKVYQPSGFQTSPPEQQSTQQQGQHRPLGNAHRATSLPELPLRSKRRHDGSQHPEAGGGFMRPVFAIPNMSETSDSRSSDGHPAKRIRLEKTDEPPTRGFEIENKIDGFPMKMMKMMKINDQIVQPSGPHGNLATASEPENSSAPTKRVKRVRFKNASKIEKKPRKHFRPWHEKSGVGSRVGSEIWPRVPVAIQNLVVRSEQLKGRIGSELVGHVSRPAWEIKTRQV